MANVLRFCNIRSVVAFMHDVFHGYDAATLIYTRLTAQLYLFLVPAATVVKCHP